MMFRRVLPLRAAALSLALVVAALASGCAGRQRLPSGERTVVTFVNESTTQADLFAVVGGASYRLGTVGPNRAEELRIPEHVVRAGTGGVNFVARLFPGRGTLQSGIVTVVPGDALTVRLPASLNLLVVTPG
jgi:hypothetical protein